MRVIIQKRPSEQNLVSNTISISQREFELIQDKNIKSEIRVYTQENELVHTVEQGNYQYLTCYAKTGFSDLGDASGHYYVVDFSEAIS